MSLSRSRRVLLLDRRRTVVIVAAAIVPALAACNGAAAPVPRPYKSPSAAPAMSGTPAFQSAQQQVIAARTNYTVAVGEAEKSRNATKARALLRPYLAADRIDGLVQTMSSIWARGEVFYGEDVLHIVRVTVTDTTDRK